MDPAKIQPTSPDSSISSRTASICTTAPPTPQRPSPTKSSSESPCRGNFSSASAQPFDRHDPQLLEAPAATSSGTTTESNNNMDSSQTTDQHNRKVLVQDLVDAYLRSIGIHQTSEDSSGNEVTSAIQTKVSEWRGQAHHGADDGDGTGTMIRNGGVLDWLEQADVEVETDSRGYFAVDLSAGVRWSEVLEDNDFIIEAEREARALLGNLLSNADTCMFAKGPKFKLEILPSSNEVRMRQCASGLRYGAVVAHTLVRMTLAAREQNVPVEIISDTNIIDQDYTVASDISVHSDGFVRENTGKKSSPDGNPGGDDDGSGSDDGSDDGSGDGKGDGSDDGSDDGIGGIDESINAIDDDIDLLSPDIDDGIDNGSDNGIDDGTDDGRDEIPATPFLEGDEAEKVLFLAEIEHKNRSLPELIRTLHDYCEKYGNMNGTFGIKCDDSSGNAEGNIHITMIVIKKHPLELLKMIDFGPDELTDIKKENMMGAFTECGIKVASSLEWERYPDGQHPETGNAMAIGFSMEHFLFKGAHYKNGIAKYTSSEQIPKERLVVCCEVKDIDTVMNDTASYSCVYLKRIADVFLNNLNEGRV